MKELFPGGFSVGSVKSQFEHSLKTFNWVMALESFTGGGGDADLCDENLDDKQITSSEDYKMCLKGDHSQGLDVGGLTVKAIKEWYNHGWYDLFHNQ